MSVWRSISTVSAAQMKGLNNIVINVFCLRCTYSRGKNGRDGHFVAVHGDHIHVIHGCTSPSCRHFESGRPLSGYLRVRDEPVSKYGPQRLRNLWKYLVSGGSRRAIFWSNSPRGTPIFNGNYHLGEWEPEEEADQLYTECERSGCDGTSQQGKEIVGEGDQLRSSSPKGKDSVVESIWQTAVEEWTATISTLLAFPDVMDQHLSTLVYGKRKLLDNLKNYRTVQFNRMECWKFNDFKRALDGKNPSFGVPRDALLDRQTTYELLLGWLEFQFPSIEQADGTVDHMWPIEFLKWVKHFNRENGKQYTICFVGGVSTGKTFWCKLWCRLAMYSGRIVNWKKGMQFCFDNCINQRVLFNDECVFPLEADDHMETMKEVTAGSNPAVNVKNESLQHIGRPPVYLAANKDPFHKCMGQRQYFVPERILYYDLRYSPEFDRILKDSEKSDGNPLALFDLYEHAMWLINEAEQ